MQASFLAAKLVMQLDQTLRFTCISGLHSKFNPIFDNVIRFRIYLQQKVLCPVDVTFAHICPAECLHIRNNTIDDQDLNRLSSQIFGSRGNVFFEQVMRIPECTGLHPEHLLQFSNGRGMKQRLLHGYPVVQQGGEQCYSYRWEGSWSKPVEMPQVSSKWAG